MASITKHPDGRRTIQVVGADHKRRSIRLGQIPDHVAETVRDHVEELALAIRTGRVPHKNTSEWVHSLEPEAYDKIAAAGLVPKRQTPPTETVELGGGTSTSTHGGGPT